MSFLDKIFNKGPKPIIAESQPRDLSILKAGNRPQGPGVMAAQQDEYYVTASVEFTAEDSGEEGKPIVYRAEKDAEVIFDGGVSLNGADFIPASSPSRKSNILTLKLCFVKR